MHGDFALVANGGEQDNVDLLPNWNSLPGACL